MKKEQEQEQENPQLKEEEDNSPNAILSSEELKAKKESDSLLAALQYRDRAKERRKQFGSPEPPSPPSPTYSSSKTKSTSNQSNDVSYIESKFETLFILNSNRRARDSNLGKSLFKICSIEFIQH